MPGLFAAQGLVEIEVHVNDKATAIFPPYSTTEQQVFVEVCARPSGSKALELERV